MVTYPTSSNFRKNIFLQCHWLHNFPSFRSSHWRRCVRKGVLRNFAKLTGKHLSKSLFFNKVAGWGDCFWSFSWRFLAYFISIEKWNEKREIPWWSSNINFFARVSICLTSTWSENVFKGDLMLQFSWLTEFC